MSDSTDQSKPRPAEGSWAKPVSKLRVDGVPQGAINLNVSGRQLAGPLQGFGQMWQKTYQIRLSGTAATPEQVMRVWKEDFPRFQPPENHFYPPMSGVKPGEIVFIDSTLPVVPGLPGLVPMASGVLVLYADEASFTVMAPEGFPEAGWNTFSTYEEEGSTVARIQSLCRAADPIYEFGFRFMGGAGKQEKTWLYVLDSLAAYFGVRGQARMHKVCVDPKLQWSQAKNVWHNAGIRTMLYSPVRLMHRVTGRH